MNNSGYYKQQKTRESQISKDRTPIKESPEENLDDSLPSYISEEALKENNEIFKK